MHRVLVFGSRDWTDVDLIRRRLERFPSGTTVIHGAAHGADTIGGDVATELGFTVIAEPADWSQGRGAGPIRNQRMLEIHRPTCGLGFMVGWTRGSADMLQRLIKAGLPVDLCSRPPSR
jgi:hypothetical protein